MPVMTIVLLLFPTLYSKRGIFTHSPLLWVFHPISFHCYHVHLPCFKINLISVDNSLIIFSLRSKVLVERSQCLD